MVSAVNKKQNKKPLILKDTLKTAYGSLSLRFRICTHVDHNCSQLQLEDPVLFQPLWVPGTHMVYVEKNSNDEFYYS